MDRSTIATATPYPGRITSWGAHGWRGRWLVNGSSNGIVLIEMEPRQPGRVLTFPLRTRELAVSLDDPSGFLADIGARSAPT